MPKDMCEQSVCGLKRDGKTWERYEAAGLRKPVHPHHDCSVHLHRVVCSSDRSRSVTKLTVMCDQGLSDTGRGRSLPVDSCHGVVETAHSAHDLTYFSTSAAIVGHQYRLAIICLIPGCPVTSDV